MYWIAAAMARSEGLLVGALADVVGADCVLGVQARLDRTARLVQPRVPVHFQIVHFHAHLATPNRIGGKIWTVESG